MSAEAQALDVTDEASVQTLFEAGQPFDIVIANAGISAAGSSVLDTAQDDFEAVIDTNLTGVFAVAQAAARGMKEAGVARSSTSPRSSVDASRAMLPPMPPQKRPWCS